MFFIVIYEGGKKSWNAGNFKTALLSTPKWEKISKKLLIISNTTIIIIIIIILRFTEKENNCDYLFNINDLW